MGTRKIILSLMMIAFFIGADFFVGSTLGYSSKVVDETPGFVSSKTNTTLNLNDGQIDPFWSSVESYQNVSEYGSEGYVKFANNETHLYALLVSSASSEWISIEFDADTSACMMNQHDGWAIYIDENAKTVEAKDVFFVGTRMPSEDNHNDLLAEGIFTSDLVEIEVVRLLDTTSIDSTGYDIVYQNGSIIMVQFASKSDHFGSHTFYYILTSFSTLQAGNVPGNVPVPTVINYDQLKLQVLSLTMLSGFGFIILHFIRRVIISPIKHDYRLISSDIPTKLSSSNRWRSPTFRERWNETFSSEE
ncbi:MAG: hypothetical protein ACFE9L_05940 [Candidatus Hodarchaeota archaeon]